jgi:CubicO group peptidase (beta-lactamase class C family)
MRLLYVILLLPSLALSQKYKKDANEILKSSFNNGPGCAALISVDGDTEYSYCTGMANIELEVPIKLEHKFRIGSITKQFTAIAIMILEERGKLDLNDSIQKYISYFPVKNHTVTIEHLLTHTSGIKSYTTPDIMDEDFMRIYHHPDSLVNSFSEFPLEFEPGSKFSYSNSGYHLLGLIIEKASGKSYSSFIKKEIFDKAGMKDSRTDSNKEIIKNRISGYDPFIGPVNAQYIDMSIPYSAGNIISTVSDLNLWYKTLFNYEIIEKETLIRAHTPYELSDGTMSNYGYGWGLDTIQGQPVIRHSGGIPGFLSNGIYFTEQKLLTVILSNCTCNPPQESSMKIAELAIEEYLDKKE